MRRHNPIRRRRRFSVAKADDRRPMWEVAVEQRGQPEARSRSVCGRDFVRCLRNSESTAPFVGPALIR